MVIDKLKEIIQLQNNIKLGNVEYTAKKRNAIILANALYLLFLGDMHEGHLSLKDADEKQIQLVKKLKDMGKDKIRIKKKISFKECKIIS